MAFIRKNSNTWGDIFMDEICPLDVLSKDIESNLEEDESTESKTFSPIDMDKIFGTRSIQNLEDIDESQENNDSKHFHCEESELDNPFIKEFESILRSSSESSQVTLPSSNQGKESENEVEEVKTPQPEIIKNNESEKEDYNEDEISQESRHLFRPDNVRKATIRALNKVVRVHMLKCLQDYSEATGINLKRNFSKYRVKVFEFFKTSVDEVLGYSLSELEMKEVYAILFDLCLKKKQAFSSMISFSSANEKRIIAEALGRYKKQGRSYTKQDGDYCFGHIMMKIAKKLYFSHNECKKVFRDQVLDLKKKVGIRNSEAYLNRLAIEINLIGEE